MQATTTQQERSRGWRRPRWLVAGLRGLEIVELTIGAILILGIVILVMLQVLARVTPIDNQVWTGELARFSLVWLSFGLAGYLLGRDEHIALDVADHVLPALGQRLVKAFSLLVVAATAAMFGYEGLDLFTSDSPIKSPATGIPLAWIYFIPMVGMALTVLRALIEIIWPSSHQGQIRVAGEVIADETLGADGDALTHAALGEIPPSNDEETSR
ncbi:TRAP transporter small permease [Nocardioides sp. NPDC004968]|uniref:TRAP transporter small permease n=1 Tax=Nocardioides sp. NPDC004968 TaxID=3155894 RepID=UPI0033AB4A59